MTPLIILSEEPRGSYQEGGTFNISLANINNKSICSIFLNNTRKILRSGGKNMKEFLQPVRLI